MSEFDKKEEFEKNEEFDRTLNIFQGFADSVAEIFNDPKLKEKAEEFGKLSMESAKDLRERLYAKDLHERLTDLEKTSVSFKQKLSDKLQEATEAKSNKDAVAGHVAIISKPDLAAPSNGHQIMKDQKVKKGEAPIEKSLEDNEKQRREPIGKEKKRKVPANSSAASAGRIVGYTIAIFWNVLLIVFFNFYSDFIALYTSRGIIPVLTADWKAFLPIVTVTLAASIIGNIILIINNRFELKQMIEIILILLTIASVITLIYIFPFDFSAVLNAALSYALRPIMTIVLIVFAVMLGIGALIRFIRYVIHLSRSHST